MDMEAYLSQDSKWINRDGGFMEISDMAPLWRRNAARWLVRNAAAIRQAYELSRFRNQLIAFDEGDEGTAPEVAELLRESTADLVSTLAAISKPDEWVQTTTLYRALSARDTDGLASLTPGGPDVVYRRTTV